MSRPPPSAGSSATCRRPSADGSLTGRGNATFFARLHGLPSADRARRIDETLELMDFAGAADRVVRAYSGGMVRRLESAAP